MHDIRPMSRVVELLGPDGPLARSLEGYEHRQGQLEMARAVEDAFEHDRLLICEAGTGTGKTLAYLVPAISSGRKVVVSTATKALQDQIVSHDVPALERHLGLKPRVAVAKGLANYLCRRRLDEFLASPESSARQHARSLAMINEWVKTTETGDVAELTALPENDATWREVCSGTDVRRGNRCAAVRDCFVARMRRACEAAQIVIANHHLVFADLALREGSDEHAGVLPPHEALIFDEAHQIEDIASDFFGVQVSSSRVEGLLRETEHAFEAAGLSDPLIAHTDGAQLIDKARVASRALFDELVVAFGRSESGRKPIERDAWTQDLIGRYHRLDAALEAVAALADKHGKDDAVQDIGWRVTELRDDLARVIDGSAATVTWIEVRARSASIGATPIEVATTLRARLFERIPTVVLTSATLSTGGTFDFFRSRVGVDSPRISLQESIVPSPFDFENAAMLYTPVDLPEPSDPQFSTKAAGRAAELIALTGGGALVLCTSNRAMATFRDELEHLLHRSVAMQGDAPKTRLLDGMRRHGHGVLVATMSFWEGVDIAGDALRLVIIDKLPFSVPTDPVVVARCKALEEAGENPFLKYHVPSTAITLKQGFGRLIRTQRDRGIVAILDRRLVKRGYGKSLLASLPPATRTTSMQDVRQFWERVERERATSGDGNTTENAPCAE